MSALECQEIANPFSYIELIMRQNAERPEWNPKNPACKLGPRKKGLIRKDDHTMTKEMVEHLREKGKDRLRTFAQDIKKKYSGLPKLKRVMRDLKIIIEAVISAIADVGLECMCTYYRRKSHVGVYDTGLFRASGLGAHNTLAELQQYVVSEKRIAKPGPISYYSRGVVGRERVPLAIQSIDMFLVDIMRVLNSYNLHVAFTFIDTTQEEPPYHTYTLGNSLLIPTLGHPDFDTISEKIVHAHSLLSLKCK